MIRLTALQFRAQAVVALGALVLVLAVAVITGPQLAHLYATSVATCQARGDCPAARDSFLRNDSGLRNGFGLLVVVAPAVLGAFWGAPLVAREFEEGTFRLAWTQSVTRVRWLAVKLGVLGLACTAAAGLLSLAVTWWAGPLDRAGMNAFGSYSQRDLVPIGYAAFALVLGVAAGALIRRTLPAVATTPAVFLAARLGFAVWVRPTLITPVYQTLALEPGSTGYGSSGFLPLALLSPSTLQPQAPDLPNAWITSVRIVDGSGRGLTSQVLASTCPNLGKGDGPAAGAKAPAHPASAAAQQTLHDCVARIGATYHEVVAYQPADRYWALQWYELGIFLGAALALAGLCVWRVRRMS